MPRARPGALWALALACAAAALGAAPRPAAAQAYPDVPAAAFCDFVQSLSILKCAGLGAAQTALLKRSDPACSGGGAGTAGQLEPIATSLAGAALRGWGRRAGPAWRRLKASRRRGRTTDGRRADGQPARRPRRANPSVPTPHPVRPRPPPPHAHAGAAVPRGLADLRPLPASVDASVAAAEGATWNWLFRVVSNLAAYTTCSPDNGGQASFLVPAGWTLAKMVKLPQGAGGAGAASGGAVKELPFAAVLSNAAAKHVAVAIRGTQTKAEWYHSERPGLASGGSREGRGGPDRKNQSLSPKNPPLARQAWRRPTAAGGGGGGASCGAGRAGVHPTRPPNACTPPPPLTRPRQTFRTTRPAAMQSSTPPPAAACAA
jgi:hypothetical protein